MLSFFNLSLKIEVISSLNRISLGLILSISSFRKLYNSFFDIKVFSVKYPLETAEFLMTAYVFVSNNISIRYLKKEPVNSYLNAFKVMLEQSLNTKKLFSN